MAAEELFPEVMEAHVFRAERRKRGTPIIPNTIDWDSFLRDLKNGYSLKERTVGGVIFDPIEIDGLMMLGVHKPLSVDFMTSIDDDSQDVGNFQSVDTDSRMRFAFSSIVMFSDVDHIFAMARGSRESPHHTAMGKFFSSFAVTPARERWVIEPFMAPDQLDELAKAKGMARFQSSFTTPRTLLDPKAGNGGVITFAQQMSNEVGVELKIDLRVQVAKGNFSSLAAERLLSLFRRDQQDLTRSDSRAKAKALLPNGMIEELNLVRHNMAFSFELPILTDEQKNFTKLAEGLQNVRAELNNQIQ